MSSEFDKKMDSLLRAGARRERAASAGRSAPGAETSAGGSLPVAVKSAAHLDADEQNAYAENALPAATRHAYAAHLADCDDCRRSVTQLALAAGIPIQLEERETSRPEKVLPNDMTWIERLGAFFAPRAWRYAIPALALLLVSAVALMVLTRSSQRDSSIAQRNTEQAAKPSIGQTEETQQATQNNNVAAAPEGETVAGSKALNSNALPANVEIAADSTRGKEPKAGGATKDTATPSTSAGAAAAPAADLAAPAPTPVSPEAIIVADESASKSKATQSVAELARVQENRTQNQTYQRDDANMTARRNEPRRSGPSRGNNIEQAPPSVAGIANTGESRNNTDKKNESVEVTTTPAPPATKRSARQRNADSERDESKASANSGQRESTRSPGPAGETRTVAGRKFRRQDGAWIDTAYNSAQAVTIVRRNSEQYRALIADEPALRRIADALGGEVIIVWKGRSYRIR